MFNYPSAADLLELLAPASRAGSPTAVATGAAVDMRDYAGRAALLLLSNGAASGTTPTLDVKLRHSHDGTTWADVTDAAFDQITAVDLADADKKLVVDCDQLRRYVEGYAAIGGTAAPTFVFGLAVRATKGDV
jgi:hypothetical protein